MAVDINGDGLIALGGTSTTQGRVRLAEDTDNGTNYVELTSNAAVTTNRTVTFPDADINFTTGLGAAQGGTGVTSAGTVGNVLTSNGTAWVSQAISAGGDYIMVAYTSPATWTKPAGLKAVKVTVIGAGGNGGSGNITPCVNYGGNGGGGGGAILYADAPAVPGPITVTVGTAPSKTSSFGPLVSATGGTNGSNATLVPAPIGPYAGGAGSSGTVNFSGQDGYGTSNVTGATSGASALAFGPGKVPVLSGPFVRTGVVYGGGGTGGYGSAPTAPGGAGAAGIVIVEEFY
jgi:hypothetical protein